MKGNLLMRFGFIAALVFAGLMSGPVSASPNKEVIRKADPSIGRVVTGRGSGSGFVVGRDSGSKDLFFVTNHHVIEGAKKGFIGFNVGGKVVSYGFKIISKSKELDLAIIRLIVKDQTYVPPIIPISSPKLEKGDEVFALGFPGMSSRLQADKNSPEVFETTLTSGIVSKVIVGTWTGTQSLEIVHHTATVNPGNSGGPLIDYCGSVVGVNTAIFTDSNGGNVSSSSDVVINFLRTAKVPFRVVSDTCVPAEGAPTAREVAPGGSGAGLPSGPLGLPTWGIVLIALGAIGAIGGGVAYATRQKSSLGPAASYGDSSLVGAAVAPKTKTAALQLLAKLPDGEIKKFNITSQQLRDGVSIGRSSSAGITIDSPKISREHARLKLDGRKLVLVDLGSTNGSEIDGKKLSAKASQQVNTSSAVTFGNVKIKLSKP